MICKWMNLRWEESSWMTYRIPIPNLDHLFVGRNNIFGQIVKINRADGSLVMVVLDHDSPMLAQIEQSNLTHVCTGCEMHGALGIKLQTCDL